MKFEDALKAMREGKKVKLKKSNNIYFMATVPTNHSKSNGFDVRIYCRANGKVSRVTKFGTRYLTMLDWEVVDD